MRRHCRPLAIAPLAALSIMGALLASPFAVAPAAAAPAETTPAAPTPAKPAASTTLPPATPCGQVGDWLLPGNDGRFAGAVSAPLSSAALIDRLADRQTVLLGETHNSAEDHRWQLHTLAQLHARHPQLALALEMFPRRLQPVLDRWVAGELSEAAFLRESEWDKVWGYDARDYLPLFHFARMNRVPMLAMNVERTLVDAVSRDGWEAVPETQKEGVTRPAKPSPAYLERLRDIFEHHPERKRGDTAFPRFVEAQTLWDRGMAQTIAEHLRTHPDSLVVGIVGAGHVRHGDGIAHQLRDLGIERSAGLITWNRDLACGLIADGVADAVRIVSAPTDNPPRLGIAMKAAKAGVGIDSVLPGSVAERAGVKAGDLLVEAAGRPLRDMTALQAIVQRQAPGTWLPLKVKRDGKEIEIVARFPAAGQ